MAAMADTLPFLPKRRFRDSLELPGQPPLKLHRFRSAIHRERQVLAAHFQVCNPRTRFMNCHTRHDIRLTEPTILQPGHHGSFGVKSVANITANVGGTRLTEPSVQESAPRRSAIPQRCSAIVTDLICKGPLTSVSARKLRSGLAITKRRRLTMCQCTSRDSVSFQTTGAIREASAVRRVRQPAAVGLRVSGSTSLQLQSAWCKDLE